MPQFRYVAISPARIEDRKRLGPAVYLHEFLVDHQTDAEGNVNYGKPFCYAWIRAHWLAAPPERTLQRHMAILKSKGFIRVKRAPWDQGMRVMVLGSAKWAPAAPKARQLSLFAPEPVEIGSGKAVSNLSKQAVSEPPKVADHPRQKWRRNEVKNLREEKTNSNPARFARSSPVEDAERLRQRRQLLKDQARQIESKYKTS